MDLVEITLAPFLDAALGAFALAAALAFWDAALVAFALVTAMATSAAWAFFAASAAAAESFLFSLTGLSDGIVEGG